MSTFDPTSLPQRKVIPTGPKIIPRCPHCNGEPLIDDKCPKCDYVRVKGYNIQPDTDMNPHGFSKELDWRSIHKDNRDNKYHVLTYAFDVNAFSCDSCKTVDWTWLRGERTGVYKSCLGCGKTTGPVSMEFGELISDKIVKPEVAFGLYKARGLKPPQELQDLIMLRRSRLRKQKLRGKRKNVKVY